MSQTQYPPSYFTDRVDARRIVMMRQEKRRIYKTDWHKYTILDIGCADGAFLSLFDGWHRFGIEPYDDHVDWIDYRVPDADQWADVIVMRGVLQHLDRPISTLDRALSWLRPGGLLAILATPNTGSLRYRIWQDLPALDPPRNYTYWSAKQLRSTLTNLGYRNIEFHYPYWGTPYAQPVRDLGRFLTGRPGAFPGSMMECFARR